MTIHATTTLIPAATARQRQWSWGQIRGLLADRAAAPATKAVAALVPEAAARGLAFDTWIGQTDHADHPHNIIFGYDPGDEADRSFVFLDYAMAMGVKGMWENRGYATCSIAPFPQYMTEKLDRRVLAETIRVIENMPEGQIREVVERIPASHLPGEKGGVIADGLIERRALIRSTLAPHLEGRP